MILLQVLGELIEVRQPLMEGLLSRIAPKRLLKRDVERFAVRGYFELFGRGVALGVPHGVPPLGLGLGASVDIGRVEVDFGGDGPDVFRLIIDSLVFPFGGGIPPPRGIPPVIFLPTICDLSFPRAQPLIVATVARVSGERIALEGPRAKHRFGFGCLVDRISALIARRDLRRNLIRKRSNRLVVSVRHVIVLSAPWSGWRSGCRAGAEAPPTPSIGRAAVSSPHRRSWDP